MAQKNNIIAIASGKGGVGKTWLSATLAHLFARAGRKTLLVDGEPVDFLYFVLIFFGLVYSTEISELTKHLFAICSVISFSFSV